MKKKSREGNHFFTNFARKQPENGDSARKKIIIQN